MDASALHAVLANVLSNLHTTLTIHDLKPEQTNAWLSLLEGRHTLVVLPTGFGKSLIFQLIPMLKDRVSILNQSLILEMKLAYKDNSKTKICYS